MEHHSYLLEQLHPLTGLDVNVTDKDSGSPSKGSNKVIPTFYQMGANRDKAIKCGCFLPSDGSIALRGNGLYLPRGLPAGLPKFDRSSSKEPKIVSTVV